MPFSFATRSRSTMHDVSSLRPFAQMRPKYQWILFSFSVMVWMITPPRIYFNIVAMFWCFSLFLFFKLNSKVYSNVRNFKKDLANFKPHFLIVVPRLLETIWKVGTRNREVAKN